MEKIKLYIKANADKKMNDEEIVKLKDTIKEKYNVILPNDYCEFLKLSNGFNFHGDNICNNETIIESTDELKELNSVLDTNLTKKFENYIVVGNIYEHGYVVYLNESKKYALIEDLFIDFSLDGKDENLLYFSNIWEVFIYYDYDCGSKIFKVDYNKIFKKIIEEKNKKFEELYNNYLNEHKKIIEKLHDDVIAKNAIELQINVDDDYLKVLEKEYGSNIRFLKMGTCTEINYNVGNSFNLNLNFIDNKIDIINFNKVASRSFPGIDFSIESFINKRRYYVLRIKDRTTEPIIIFKKYLNEEIMCKLEKVSRKESFLRRLLRIYFKTLIK